MKNSKTFEIEYKGEIYDAEWFEGGDFEKANIHGVAGFIFDKKGKLCMVRVGKKRGWTLPGGGVEKCDKTPEDAFIRETQEEADLDLKNIKRLGYWKSFPRKNPKDIAYTGRFVAEVKKIKPQTIDPAEGVIPERVFINPKDFNKYTNWKANGEFQLKKALKLLKQKKK